MGIFDDVVVNAKSAAQTVGKMAGQFVDMSKLRINMSELNGEITKRYQELGRFIYEAKKAGSADEAELADQIAGTMICMHSFPRFPHSTLPCRIK